MVTRISLNDKTQQEVQSMLQADLEEYAVMVNEIADKEGLLNMEASLMTEHDNFQAILKQTNYDLVDEILFDGEVYKKSEIADHIAYFLNKHEVEWSYTLGMYQLVQLWRNANITQIPYEAYDSTLRVLNQTKFKGYTEWRDILAANEFLSSCHAEYVRDTSYLIYLSQKHNILLDKLKAQEPQEEAPTAE
jgi:hypothetical protein